MKKHVGVIFGGRSGEHEVSLLSARSVLAAIDPARYDVTLIGIDLQGRWWTGPGVLDALASGEPTGEIAALLPDPSRSGLFILRPSADSAEQKSPTGLFEHVASLDVLLPVLHGTFGEDGTLQGFLELADLAYTGAGVLGSALGMDKSVFKDVMRGNNIPVVDTITVLRSEIELGLDQVIEKSEALCSYPVFVKPANLGSSVGITKCHNRSDLVEGLIEAARYDRRILVERGLDAREIEVGVIGNDHPEASIPGEIIPNRDYYSYESKYLDNESIPVIPAPLSEELTERVRKLALQAYRAIDCAGMARVDFLLEKKPSQGDGLYLSEINTIPGFTQISMFPKLWEASGVPYPILIDRLIELALERKADRNRTERHYRRD